MTTFTQRSATPEDAALLYKLFAENKAAEFAVLRLPPESLQMLVEMQHRAQQVGYAQQYPAAVDMILCTEDGAGIGRHLVERQPDGYRTIDIAVLEAWRGRGAATWALEQLHAMAAVEALPLRLAVMKTSPAVRLYERLGYARVDENELQYEMERRPASYSAAKQSQLAPTVAVKAEAGETLPRQQVLDALLPFLREIGLTVELGPVAASSFLPGLQLIPGGLRVDLDTLRYPGDVLHEAGHLAVMTPARRANPAKETTEQGEEIAAQAWSYAAAVHLALPPEVVFHEHGYRGSAQWLIDSYGGPMPPGAPLLAWMELCGYTEEGRTTFPQMKQWLRDGDQGTGIRE